MENGQKDEEEVMPSTSSALPAHPKNGVMKTYDNPSRKFTRPYSAKTVYFYKEGDIHFTGIRLPVSHHRYKTLNTLMDELNRNMYLPFGVRNITTPMGRTNINSLEQLQHLGRYVASSSNPPKGVDLDKIQEKYSATLRRDHPQRTTAGGHSYWMPTTPTIPARIHASHLLRALHLISAKQVFFVLNGKGVFYRNMINPMKMPTMEQLLEECSSHLMVAIHRLYTPEGKLITTVEEILAYNGPRIIACPRNERPHLHEMSGSSTVKLPEIHPTRYAPRRAYSKPVSETKSSTGGSGGALASGSSSGNSIEKRQRLPALNNRYVPKAMENGTSLATTKTNYMTKSYLTRTGKPDPVITKNSTNKPSTEINRKTARKKNTVGSSATSNASTKGGEDSGTGTSINSSQQSDRPESMTERKAQMIRDELNEFNANLKRQHPKHSSSEPYSEEDMIREEESDYDHLGGGIHSGTSDEEEDDNKTLKRRKSSKKSSGSSHRTPSLRTPSTAGSGKLSGTDKRLKTMSRQDTPYLETPSRQNTVEEGSTPSEPRSSHSSRASTSSKAIIEDSEEEDDVIINGTNIGEEEDNDTDDDDETEDDNDSMRETPAVHTPDTRLPTALSRKSTAGSARSFASDSSRAWSRISGYSDKEVILPSDEDDDPHYHARTSKENVAATIIQVAYKKYSERKKQVKFLKEHDKEEEEKARIEENRFQQYKIEIQIGGRFGVEFDTPLFVVLHGDDGSSEKLFTTQKNWLFSFMDFYPSKIEDDDPNEGRQTQDDKLTINMTRTCLKLGELSKIDVGHEKEGYGAGTYISNVIVTEEGAIEGRRFYFQVDKWFDSEQTDGLIERSIDLNSILYLEADMDRRKVSQGRWEFRLHSMHSDLGGTTSNLTVIGTGTEDYAAYWIRNDTLLRDPKGVSLIQIDFGPDIGSLRKVRFEIDGAGDKPNYFLEYVEAKDLDTQERCAIMVHNWLLIGEMQGHKKWQPFREFPLFSKRHEPIPMRTYEGTVIFADKSLLVSEDAQVFLEFHSQGKEEDELATDMSGQFPIIPTRMKSGNIHYTYKVDIATTFQYPNIRIVPKLTKLGKDVLEGFCLLEETFQRIADREDLHSAFPVGNDLFIKEIRQKYGDHTPHMLTYETSRIVNDPNNPQGPYFKELLPKGASSVSTEKKRNKSEVKVREFAHWELVMNFNLESGNPDIPTVVLVAKDGNTFEMECLTGKLEADDEYNHFLRYTLTAPNFGNPFKCRISLENQTPGSETKVFKMILTEVNTNTQVFFKVNREIFEFHTEEFQCTYPDIGVKEIKEYEVDITTLDGGGNFRPYINIIGDGGDTGYRAYPGDRSFALNPVSELFIYALDLHELRRIEVWAKTGEPQNWKGTIKVIVMNEWEFESGILELTTNGQIALSSLAFKRRIEPLISGETDV